MQKLRWTERDWSRGFSFSLWNFQSGLMPLGAASGSKSRRLEGVFVAIAAFERVARGRQPWFLAGEPGDWMRRAKCVRGVPKACRDDLVFVSGDGGSQVMVLGPASGKAGGQTGEDPRRNKGRRADRPTFSGWRTDRRRSR